MEVDLAIVGAGLSGIAAVQDSADSTNFHLAYMLDTRVTVIETARCIDLLGLYSVGGTACAGLHNLVDAPG